MSPGRRRLLQAAAGLAAGRPLASPAAAEPAVPAELAGLWPEVRLQGQARMRFLGLSIYDIRLWVPTPLAPARSEQQPLALEILYARALDGPRIAERSLDEMRRDPRFDPGRAADWLAAMRRLFPDVQAGDRITGLQQPAQAARFWVNGRAAGEVRDPLFTTLFFGIWLSPGTSEPALRDALLGARG